MRPTYNLEVNTSRLCEISLTAGAQQVSGRCSLRCDGPSCQHLCSDTCQKFSLQLPLPSNPCTSIIDIHKARSQYCDKWLLASSCLSVHPQRPRPPLDRLSWNLIFKDSSKICWENSGFFKIRQEWRVIYVKTDIHFLTHLAHFLLEWQMFQTKFVEKINTHILCPVNFFYQISCCFMRQCGKLLYSTAGHRWQYGTCTLHAGHIRLQLNTLRLCNTHCFSTATMVA